MVQLYVFQKVWKIALSSFKKIISPKKVGKSKENSKIPTLEKEIKFRKNIFGSYSDTKIGPWFRFPIPKSGFGCKYATLDFCPRLVRKGHYNIREA